MKLTKDQRHAAGWQLCWGLYDYGDELWYGDSMQWFRNPSKRWAADSSWEAALAMAKVLSSRTCTSIRPFWRRVRPKPTETIIRVAEEIQRNDIEGVLCRGKSGCTFYVLPEDLERQTRRAPRKKATP